MYFFQTENLEIIEHTEALVYIKRDYWLFQSTVAIKAITQHAVSLFTNELTAYEPTPRLHMPVLDTMA
jgi:hypothetical protein